MRYLLLAVVLLGAPAAVEDEPPDTPAARAETIVRLYHESDTESLAGFLADTFSFDSGRGEPRDRDGFLAFVTGNPERYTDQRWEITFVGVSSERVDVRGHWEATKKEGRRVELDFSFDLFFDESGKVVRWVNEFSRRGIQKPVPAEGLFTTSHFLLVFDPAAFEPELAARLARVSEEYYEKTSKYLGRSFQPGFRLPLNVSEAHTIPYASAPGPDAFILIPLSYARREYGFSMVHEFTHNMIGLSHLSRQPSTVQGRELRGGNRLLDEGFAVFVEEKLTAEPRVWPNWGEETHLGYRNLRAKLEAPVWPLLEAELHRFYASTDDEGRLGYLQQGSFCKWLVESHGLERFLRFHEQGIESAAAIYEKEFAALEADWGAFLEARADD